jgi:hypothetical protein
VKLLEQFFLIRGVKMIEQMKAYNSLIAKYKLSEIFFQKEQDPKRVEKAISRLQQITQSLKVLEKCFEVEKVEVSDIEVTEGFNIEYREQRFKIYGF